jgi:hypothetical protein
MPQVLAADLQAVHDYLQRRAIRNRREVDLVERQATAIDQQPAEALAAERFNRRGDRRRVGRRLRPRRVVGLRGVALLAKLVHLSLGGVGVGHGDDLQVEPDQEPRADRQLAELPRHDLRGLADDDAPAVPAEGASDAGVEQPHVIVDLGRGADCRARVADAVLLPDGNRRRDAVDAIDVGLLHPLEELPRVSGQRFDISALAFGVDRVESERRLPRSAHTGDDDQLAGGQRDVDVLEVVRARAADDQVAGLRRPG